MNRNNAEYSEPANNDYRGSRPNKLDSWVEQKKGKNMKNQTGVFFFTEYWSEQENKMTLFDMTTLHLAGGGANGKVVGR